MHNKENLELPESQKRARALGIDYYYTGERCKHGHIDKRLTQTGNCMTCLIERGKAGKPQNERSGKKIRSNENQRLAEAAYDAGFNTYISTKSCPNGHFERYISSNNCVECNRKQMSDRAERSRWRRIKKEYGITKEEYNNIKLSQNNKCMICRVEFLEDSKIHIDHCHTTGKVRGLLCSKCNQGIGLLGDSIENLKSAIEYLRKNK